MMTFAVFGAGFLMRPIGAIVLGAYIDKVGRRKGLIVTLSTRRGKTNRQPPRGDPRPVDGENAAGDP